MSGLDEVIKDMNKKAKESVVGIGIVQYGYDRIPFTSPRMNYCTYGGLPVGKITEFFGEEHGGKTTSALDIVANYQQMETGKKVLWIDAENTFDVEWARKLGVDTDTLVIFKPTTQSAEEIFQFILDCIATGEIGLVVLDSIGVLASAQELDKSMEEKTYAGISGPLTVFGRKLEMLCQKYQCTFIGINQIRDDLNAMWGGAIKTPGGKAWKHVCTVRLQFSRGNFIDESGKEIKRSSESPAGNLILMAMIKNKSCPPNRRVGFYTINYMDGIDYISDLVDLAIKYDMIQKAGAWYDILDADTGEAVKRVQGMANVYEYLRDPDNEDILSSIEQFIESKIVE